MAKYIVVRVEDNDTAQTLLERFQPLKSVQIVGLFASPTRFCDGKEVCGADRRLIRSKRTGLWHCRVCRKAVSEVRQEPRNQLLPEDLHPRFVDFWVSVWEPLGEALDPGKKYTNEAIERKQVSIAELAYKLARRKQRTARRRQRKEA